MYVSIRRYESVPDLTGLLRDIELQFAPLLHRMPGFVAYYAVDCGAGSMATVTVFSTAAMAEESNAMAADWLASRSGAQPLLPVQITAGRMAIAVPPIRG
jgi:hypothetical protein